MKMVLKKLKDKSRAPGFVLSEFLIHHSDKLMFDLDRAAAFVYSDRSEILKADILIDRKSVV